MRAFTIGVALGLGLIGCANDPEYIPAPKPLDAGVADPTTPNKLTEGKDSLLLPFKKESAADQKTRAALAKTLAPITVPYVKVGDIEVEIEWMIENLDAKDGTASIELNGANEYFSYDPTIINLTPNDDEAPPTPGLADPAPVAVPAKGSVTGLFTEDQVREASIDLDQITRGNISPFRATLTVSKNASNFQPLSAPVIPTTPNTDPPPQTNVGNPIPREAFAYMTRIDLVFKPTTHMTLTYNVRVRDLRGIMDDLLLSAKPAELATFTPAVYNPTPADAPAP
jgi:hypothetical protein